jgi:tryptophan synthase beta chain
MGTEGVIHGCKTKLLQSTDGQICEAHSISAGLDYPGVGPLHAWLSELKRGEYLAVNDSEALDAAFELARMEGIIPALESSHALALLPRIEMPSESLVVICLSGRGDKDMETYMNKMNSTEKP